VTPQQRARRLIDENQNMVLATADPEGIPWISPVFFVPDENYNLYWTSEKTARHSENIRCTGATAIVIFDAEPGKPVDAVYMSCESDELTDPVEIHRAIAVLSRKPQPEKWSIDSVEDVSGDGPWRIYRARPTTIEVRASAVAGGRPVARRQPADFRAGA
jgi:hypothetical protein